MNVLKNYVTNNSKTLFRSNKIITNAVFDNSGFFFSDSAQLEYNLIKDLPHLYVAWTDGENGFIYIGKSFQPGGRWKRHHAYHLGTLAYHLLGTINNYDQNHQHWIDNWMDINTLNLGNNIHYIQLFKEVKICFIPFKFYSKENHLSLNKTQIRAVNKKTEEELIKSYLLDGYVLLNKQHNGKEKKVKINDLINPSNKIKANIKTYDYKNCIEFKVKQNESTHFNIQSFIFQAKTKYSIDIFETIKPTNFICTFYSFTKIPKKYFGNSDTEPKRYINRREPARWKVIQKVMIENKIQEVTIRLCPLQEKNNNKPNIKIEATPKTPILKSQTNIQNSSIDKKINELLKSLDWKKLNDKKTPKLLIIGCSDSKTQGGKKQIGINYFDSDQYDNLKKNRKANMILYNQLLLTKNNYFIYKDNNLNKPIKRSGVPVVNNYFSSCIKGNLLMPALDRYAGGEFYKIKHISLYKQKNVTTNLHILIISGLYGVIKFNDTIHDYHLKINKLKYWQKQKSIIDTIKKYIIANKIDNKSVFYSLSDEYLEVINPPSNLWSNLWVKNGRTGSLKTSANVILRFLNKL